MSPFEPDLPEGLVPDPAAPMPTVAFAGYLGESHTEGHVRLYLDEEQRDWFDVAESDIRGTKPLEEGLLPRTVLWVDQRTTLQRRQEQPYDVHGDYLDGPLAAATVGQTAMHVHLDWTFYIRLTPFKEAKKPPYDPPVTQ